MRFTLAFSPSLGVNFFLVGSAKAGIRRPDWVLEFRLDPWTYACSTDHANKRPPGWHHEISRPILKCDKRNMAGEGKKQKKKAYRGSQPCRARRVPTLKPSDC